MNKKLINIKELNDYRIVVISDVHGHKDLLVNLLEKCKLKENDYLIILGDFLNRGLNSYETYKYIVELSKREKTIILKGNHEHFIYKYLADETITDKLLEFLKMDYYESIVTSVLTKSNLELSMFSSGIALNKHFHEHHFEILEFLEKLPIIVEFDEFIFVHGGYDKNFDVTFDEAKFLKYDNYNKLSGVNEKTIVVGHWPSSNIESNILTNSPYFNKEKNIIFVDGGLGVKTSGELNAFIIEKSNKKIEYSLIQENSFKKVKISKTHIFEIEELCAVIFPNKEIEVLEKGLIMSKCRHIHTKKELSIFNSLLVEENNKVILEDDYINKFFNIEIGEDVEICQVQEECILVKYKDEFGWIMKYQIERDKL